LGRQQRPFFRRAEAGVDEGFAEIEFASIAEVFGQALQHAQQLAAALPLLKATMTGLIRGIPRRQVVPRRARAQHPQHAIQHGAAVLPRPTAAIRAATRTKHWLENLPLGVTQVHAVEYDGRRLFVHKPAFGFMR
jgi:hypothetical protein